MRRKSRTVTEDFSTRTRVAQRLRQEQALTRELREQMQTYREETHAQHEQLLESQRALRQSRDLYHDLYNSAPVAFATLDRNGVIEEINQPGCTLLNRPRERLHGRPLLIFIAVEDRNQFLEHMLRCRSGQPMVETELRLGRAHEHSVPVRLRSRPALRGSAGGMCYQTAVLDLGEQQRAAEERHHLLMQEQAARAASEAKDQFLAVLSHELRTPLMPVLAAVSSLASQDNLPEALRSVLEIIDRNVNIEARLIDDLLDITRIERGKIELDRRPVALATVLRRAIEVCKPDLNDRELDFRIEIGGGPYRIYADPARLQQIFWNLLKNAIKFTPPGGSIRVLCRESGPGFVEAHISDNGVGIEPDVLPRLFHAFEQGKRSVTRQFGGLGLGLAISKALVELHGGTLGAFSAGKGRGSCFVVRLPLTSDRAAEAAHSPALPAIRPARILLVDDHHDTLCVMRQLLIQRGHRVEIAGDVAAALRCALSQPFDLLVSDLGLPDGSGMDLVRKLRKRGLSLPAIALSGYGQEKDVTQSRAAGFNEHLVKPISIGRLEAVIAKLLGEHFAAPAAALSAVSPAPAQTSTPPS